MKKHILLILIVALSLTSFSFCVYLHNAGKIKIWEEQKEETNSNSEESLKEPSLKKEDGVVYCSLTQYESFYMQLGSAELLGEKNSLKYGIEISLSAVDTNLPPLSSGMINVTSEHQGYRFLPHGAHFSKDVSVQIGYDTNKIPKGRSYKEIRTYFYNEESKQWELLALDSISDKTQKVYSRTTHFTDMINAIIQYPELPESRSFTPSMLQELEVAQPSNGVTMIESPQANSQGTAELSYPINIPAGRNGMQPNLSLSYSSEAGNGLLGMGWDMQQPAIMVDSKWGVPRYDKDYETECYTYNGQELLPSPHYNTTWERRNIGNDSVKLFYPRTELNFDSINRIGTSPDKYFWKVLDKSGKKYYYGSYDGQHVEESVLMRDSNGNIAYWPLCKVEEADGNFLMYYYQIEEQYSGLTYLGKQLWLESIRYTGNDITGEKGAYTVFFSGDYCTKNFFENKESRTRRVRNDEIVTDPEDDCQCLDMILQIHKINEQTGEPLQGIEFNIDAIGEGENTYITDEDGNINIPLSARCNQEFILNESYMSGYCGVMRNFMFRIIKDAEGNCQFEIINQGEGAGSLSIINDNPNNLILEIGNIICEDDTTNIGEDDTTNIGEDDTTNIGGNDTTNIGEENPHLGRPLMPNNFYSGMISCDCEDEYPYDLRMDSRWGFLHSNKKKLRRILVMQDTNIVRSYSFCYGKDVFGRAQLQKIQEWGENYSDSVQEHKFSYYDDKEGLWLVSGEVEEIESLSFSGERESVNNVEALRPILSSTTTYPSILGSNRTWSIGMGGGMNVGVGINTMSRDFSMAYSMQSSVDYGKGISMMQDVTGDGLPDMLYQRQGRTYYRQQFRNENNVFFGIEEELLDIKNFLKSRTVSFSHGPSINALLHGGMNITHSTQTTGTYLSDINGDGLLDVIHDGEATTIVPRYGAPILTVDSSCTLPMLTQGESNSVMGEIILPTELYREEEEEEELPYYDLVRVWRVPTNTTDATNYKIYAPAILLEDSTIQEDYDTVLLSIEYLDADTHFLVASSVLLLGDTVFKDSLSCSYMKKSGVLFFRARTLNGTAIGHLLEWNPQVIYNKSFIDICGQRQPYAEKASDNQLLSSDGVFYCPFQGRLHIYSNDTVGPFIDSVSYTLRKNGIEMYRFDVNKSTISLQIDTILMVEQEDELSFMVEALSHVNFLHNQWHPYIYYENVSDSVFVTEDTVVNMIQIDTLQTMPLEVDTVHHLSFYPLPCYKGYNRLISIGETSNKPYFATIRPNTEYSLSINILCGQEPFGRYKMVFRTKDSVLYTQEIDMSMDTANIISVTNYCYYFHIFSGIVDSIVDSVYAECYLLDRGMETWIDRVSGYPLAPIVYAADENHPLYGSMHGGWGQFQYLHDTCSLMDTTKLKYLQRNFNQIDSTYLQQMLSIAPDSNSSVDSYNLEDSATIFSTTIVSWFSSVPLVGDGSRRCWSGLYPGSYINGRYMNLGFRALEDIEEKEEEEESITEENRATAATASYRTLDRSSTRGRKTKSMLDKVNKSNTLSLTYGLFVFGGVKSKVNSNTIRDVMDLNGDGYPDLINNGLVYYSQHKGLHWDFISPKSLNTAFHHSTSQTLNDVFTASVMRMLNKVTNNGKGGHTISDYTGLNKGIVIDKTEYTLLDINGDGLPDLVFSDGKVKLNTGYGFDIEQQWEGIDEIGIYKSETFSANVNSPSYSLLNKNSTNVSTWKASISGGIGFTLAKNEHLITLQDLTGDGLPDLVYKNSNGTIKYRLHTGIGFEQRWRQWLSFSPEAWSTSASVNADIALTGGFSFWGIVKIGGSVTTRGGYSSTSEYAQIMDFDADGLPDMLTVNDNGDLQVRYARLGRTGLLKEVTNPLGGSISIDYEMTEANVYHPRRWVMTEVKIADGLSGDGADSIISRYVYEYGYYNHEERRFLGFAKVNNISLSENGNIVRKSERYYGNEDVHLSGQLLAEVVYDSMNRRYIQTTNMIVRDTLETSNNVLRVFPKLISSTTCYFEGQPQAQITKTQTFEYENTYGNLIRQKESSTDQSAVVANIVYHPQYNGNYCVNKINMVEIRDESGNLLRQRSTDIDSMGHIIAIHDHYDSVNYLTSRMQYDKYGNIICMRSPNTTTYFEYDSLIHTYPTVIRDTFGVATYLQDYDYRFGIPKTVIDNAGNRMEYTLDNRGRILTIRGPKEIENNVPYTIKHTYLGKDSNNAVSCAMTEHYDPQHPDNPIKTYSYCDGLGRIVQTRKESEVNGEEKLVISGRVVYDGLGRVIENYYPSETDTNDINFYFANVSWISAGNDIYWFSLDPISPTRTTYDVLDRPLVKTLPDGSTTTFQYAFDNNHLGKMLFKTSVTDANGHTSIDLKDVSGKSWATKPSGQPFVYFDFNPVGDNTKVYSSLSNDWERHYNYDMLGRKTHYLEGQLSEEYEYNGNNLSTHKQTYFENNISDTNTKAIHYHYNAHRLDSVSYEDAMTTVYHYDSLGRVDSLYDESGVMCYEYGNMGEITKETRIYTLPFLTQPIAVTTQFRYDSWGRIDTIIYPDNEQVNYHYDHGGQLREITTYDNHLTNYSYLQNVTYDKFGAKISQQYGNGITTSYTYNETTRRLTEICSDAGNSSRMAYTYDAVGNVTQVTSTYPWLPNQNFTENFSYDNAYQLINAADENGSYNMQIIYDYWGKIHHYNLEQQDVITGDTSFKNYAFNYAENSVTQTFFAPETQHGTEHAEIIYGINGSLRKREIHAPEPCIEYYLFNSATNFKAYSNDGIQFAYYGYDATNTRTYKISMFNSNSWVNGEQQNIDLQIKQAMFYPNAYINFDTYGNYTKHYYNGTERIVSRLGEKNLSIRIDSNEDRIFRVQLSKKIREDIKNLIYDNHHIVRLPRIDLIEFHSLGSQDDIFYYHTNHLGSTAFVTEQNQNIIQGFVYAPFGEIVEEYNANFGNEVIPKYSFNAKELDEETGMYYYEARYYAPPVFISRDPHFERYPTFSPYTYCYNNPLKYIDPTGKDGRITIDEENKTVSVCANFYYNSSQLEQGKEFNIKNGFQKAFDSWGQDIKSAVANMGFDGYDVNIQFEWKEVDIGDATGKEAIKIIQSAANADPIGNSIVHDADVSVSAIVSGNKHLSANMTKAAHDNAVFFGTDGGNTAMHEIGHLLGLRDRYNPKKSEHAPYIKGDLMSVDYPRGNAVAPFYRIMNYNKLTPGTSKNILINKNNREPK